MHVIPSGGFEVSETLLSPTKNHSDYQLLLTKKNCSTQGHIQNFFLLGEGGWGGEKLLNFNNYTLTLPLVTLQYGAEHDSLNYKNCLFSPILRYFVCKFSSYFLAIKKNLKSQTSDKYF